MKVLAIAILSVVSLMHACGPRTTVNNTPTGVTSTQVSDWVNATSDLQKAQDLTHASLQATINLNHAKLIPDSPSYGVAITAIGRADQLEIELGQFLKTVPNTWSEPVKTKAADYVEQILAQLAAATNTGVLNVKNPATADTVSNMLNGASAVLRTILALKGAALRTEVIFVS